MNYYLNKFLYWAASSILGVILTGFLFYVSIMISMKHGEKQIITLERK